MLRGAIVWGVLAAALVVIGLASAQEPTVSPSVEPTTTAATPTGTPATLTPATTPTPAPSPPPPDTSPGEPEFNYDLVTEIVAPLVAEDGRTHYVTLSQDTAGVVRVRYSLFSFPEGFYTVYVHEGGACSPPHRSTGETWAQLRGIPQEAENAESALVLHFYNTQTISLTPGLPNSIYDEDGTTLALSVDASNEDLDGRDIACAILAAPPGAPDTGSGVESSKERRPVLEMTSGMAVVAAGLAVVWALRRRPG